MVVATTFRWRTPPSFSSEIRRVGEKRSTCEDGQRQKQRRFFYGIRIFEMICLYVGRAMVGQREDRNDSRRRVGRKIAMFRLGDESNSPGNGCSQRRGRLTKKLDVLGDIQKL